MEEMEPMLVFALNLDATKIKRIFLKGKDKGHLDFDEFL